MKGIIKIILGFLLGVTATWAFSFYINPIEISDHNFIMGVVTGLVVLSIIFTLFFSRRSKNGQAVSANNRKSFGVLISFLILLLGFGTTHLLSLKNEERLSESEKVSQQSKIDEAVISVNKNKPIALKIENLITKIDGEISNHPSRSLSEASIHELSIISQSLSPYYQLKGDSVSQKKASPEKGNLLVSLHAMKIDTSSFNKIKSKISFAGSALENGNLISANLKNIDLQEALLQKAKLQNADLSDAHLKGINLSYSDLEGALMHKTNLTNAQLVWSNLNTVKGININLDGANLSHANLFKADLKDAGIKWSMLDHASLNQADLSGANLTQSSFFKANFKQTNLSKTVMTLANLKQANLIESNLQEANLHLANLNGADLSQSDLRKTNFKKTKMIGVNLIGSKVDLPNWFEKLQEWDVEGVAEIQKKYKIVQIDQDSIYQVVLIK